MVSVRVFRCRLCQEPYIGEAPPSRCPFCGAPQQFLIPAQDWNWADYKVEIREKSKANLKRALQLEQDNTAFYQCAMNASQKNGDDYGYAKFKALRGVENEHSEAIGKMLQIDEPPLKDISCSKDFAENTQEGWDREDRAIKAYAKFAKEAQNPSYSFSSTPS